MIVAETNFLAPSAGIFVVLAIALALFVLWIWSLVDALRINDRRWIAAGQSKVLWCVLIALLGALGSLLYLVMARPSLRRQPA